MRTFSNWMIAMLMIMYWGFRVVVTYMAANYMEFIVEPINLNVEIILLFITVICIVLVFKRNLLGGIIYIVSYFGYFGIDLFKSIMPVFIGETVTVNNYMTAFTSLIALILAFVVLIDLAVDKGRKPKDKKTDWYYANEEYDRKLDERADKNNYRTL